MNREIKFRAWDKQENKMIEPFDLKELLHFYSTESCWGMQRKDLEQYNYDWRDEYPIFMQYTGLKDKNGKEIYEGDIVEIIYNDAIGVIIYDKGGYFIKLKDQVDDLIIPIFEDDETNQQYLFLRDVYLEYKIEVIGNVFENPELLEE